nr:TetR family transcriptional regulator [uncultured Actinotalea sp.]
MPRIAAPTLAEHRRNQREAILHAATELLVSQGAAAVTPAAVGAAAGLARSSVYQYFGSGAAIIAAVIEDAFPRSLALLASALADLDDPVEIMTAYVRETLRQAAEGAHRPAAALRAATLPPECVDRLDELHREQVAPFLAALDDLGVPDASIRGRLLGGVIEAAMAAVESGAELETVTRATLDLLHTAVRPSEERAPR